MVIEGLDNPLDPKVSVMIVHPSMTIAQSLCWSARALFLRNTLSVSFILSFKVGGTAK